jgi:hypothetical protein
MQRLHVEDLAGHFLQNGGWDHLSLPAVADSEACIPTGPGRFYPRKAGELLHPEREPQQALDRLKISMGSANFSAQYQQSPIPKGGHMINWDWFRRFDPNEAIGFDDVIMSWDIAMKATELSDYSVGTVWGIRGGFYYLLDLIRVRMDYPNLKRKIIEAYTQYFMGEWHRAAGWPWSCSDCIPPQASRVRHSGMRDRKRCGPSHRRARNASAVLKNFVRQPKKTFSTLSAKKRHKSLRARRALRLSHSRRGVYFE